VLNISENDKTVYTLGTTVPVFIFFIQFFYIRSFYIPLFYVLSFYVWLFYIWSFYVRAFYILTQFPFLSVILTNCSSQNVYHPFPSLLKPLKVHLCAEANYKNTIQTAPSLPNWIH
jgi:hypothetical protein